MNQIKTQTLVAACQELRQALYADDCRRHTQWADDVHLALGQLAAAVQEEVQAAEKSLEAMREINPDFQYAPVTERHNQTMRAHLIDLGEKVHQLRADLRSVRDIPVFDMDQMRRRGKEICSAEEKLRHAENDFLQTTLNTNPGAGE